MTQRTINLPGPDGYWTGETRQIEDDEGVPYGWATAPMPDLAEDEWAILVNDEDGRPIWAATKTPPMKPSPHPIDPIPQDPEWVTALLGAMTPEQVEAIKAALDRS